MIEKINSKDLKYFQGTKWNLIDIVKIILIVALLPLLIFVIVIIFSRLGLLPDSIRLQIRNSSQLIMVSYYILTLMSELLAIGWLKTKYSLSIQDIGLRKFNIYKGIGYIALALIFFLISLALVFLVITVLIPGFNTNQQQTNGFEFGKVGVGLWISFFVTVIITPIIEEVFFRGVFLPVLSKKLGIVLGVLSTSLLFGVLHAQANVIIYTFILGIILSIMYLRLKSIIPGIFLHSLNNALAFAVLAGFIK